MRTIRTLTALTGLLLAAVVRPQWPCDSLVHASFTASPDPTQDRVMHFDNTSWSALGAPVSYFWSFGNGETSPLSDVVYQYPAPGTYTVCLWVASANCADTACMTVVVGNVVSPCTQLDAGFSVTNDGLTAHFLNDSPLNTVAYEWSFGDSTYASGRDPWHTYAQYGQYEVCLKARTWDPITQGFCAIDHCELVTIQPDTTPAPCDLLDSSFTVSVQGNVVAFHSGMASDQIGYIWAFGDGSFGQEASPVHTYPHPGQYYACMTATAWDPITQDVCRVDRCEWIVVQGDSTGSPCDQLNAGFQVTVLDSIAIFHSGNVSGAVYHWSFGDGTSAFGPDPAHVYVQPGQYQACLSVWAWNPATQDSCFDQHCEWVTIVGDSLNPCAQLNAGFQVTTQGNTATFHSSNVNGAAYRWNFGDGTSAFGPNPTHTYAQPGQYLACLVTWTWDPMAQDTCFADHCEWVIINGGGSPCDSLFHTAFTYTQQNGHVVLSATSSLPAVYTWSLGDGASAQGPVAQHTYAPGQYTVCLTAWSPNGGAVGDSCYAHYCHLIIVEGDSTHSPCDDLNAGFQVTTQGSVATFHSSNVNGAVYHWNFGDGTSGQGPNPIHTYAQPGQYHACLVTYSWDPMTQDTCAADHCEWVVINGGGSPCDSLLQVSFTHSQQGSHAVFTGASTLPGTHFSWSFGDGSFGSGNVAQHDYAPGQYQVCVQGWYAVVDSSTVQDSCVATYCHLIIVEGDSTHSPCDDLNAGFQTTTQGSVATFHSSNVNGAVYHWNFGDGTTGYGPNPIHTYAQPGQYNACLVTYSWDPMTQDTCAADHCEWVVINGGGSPCDSLFQTSFTYTQQNGHVLFSGTATLPAFYTWSFGDGASANGAQTQHTYGQPGQYTVCLYAYSDLFDGGQVDSCFAQYCATIVVQGDPTHTPCDDLNAGFQVTTQGHVATFHSSNVNGAVYHWNFGDGTTGYGPNPTHAYAQPGQYHACLVTYGWDPMTQDTCFADHCEWVVIQGGGTPCDSAWVPSFDWSAGDAVIVLSNTSPGFGLDQSATWLVNGQMIGNGPQVLYHPPSSAPVIVCLEVALYDPAQQLICSGAVCDSVGLTLPTGIEEAGRRGDISVYPQPFTEQLVVNAPGLSGTVRATLLDLSGRLVDDRQVVLNGPTTIDYTALATGTYVLRLQSGAGERVVRVLKN